MFNASENSLASGLNASDLPASVVGETASTFLNGNTNGDIIGTAAARSRQSLSMLPVTPCIDTAADRPVASINNFSNALLTPASNNSEDLIASPSASIQQTSSSRNSDSSRNLDKDELLFGGLANSPNSTSARTNVQTSLRTPGIWQQGLSQRQLNQSTGTFVANQSGKVNVDFLFDGSARTGELAIFSLKRMGGLKRRDFVEEATRRALSGTSLGQIMIQDKTEAAQFSGALNRGSRRDRNFNQGKVAKTQTAKLDPRDRFAVMFVSNGTITDTRTKGKSPLFSLDAFNAKNRTQIAKAGNNVFAIEESRVGKSSADFNDIVFRVRGAIGKAKPLQQLVNPNKDWRNTPTAQQFLTGLGSSPNPRPNPEPNLGPLDPPRPDNPTPNPNGGGKIIRDISTTVSKFGGNSSEAQIIASGANKITVGTQTIYIGTEQVSGNNQNPIVRSFDSKNPKNNWTRRDIETSGTDGRGYGLLWTGKSLYGVFSVDGTQNDGTDFRQAASGAEQNWLKSYGFGGGARIGVIAQLDLRTGKLLKAAHLSAITSSGKTNSLNISDATVNSKGNLVVKAKSFFSPRQPDGSAKTQNPGNNADSPFDYTLEIANDLSRVLKTTAPGWS